MDGNGSDKMLPEPVP